MKIVNAFLSILSLTAVTSAIPATQLEQVDLSYWDLGQSTVDYPGSLYICFGLPEMPATYDCAHFFPSEATCTSLPGSGWPRLDEIRSISIQPGMICDWWIGPHCGETWFGSSAPPVSSTFPSYFTHNPAVRAMGSSFRCYSSV